MKAERCTLRGADKQLQQSCLMLSMNVITDATTHSQEFKCP